MQGKIEESLSLVIPVFNERKLIEECVKRCAEVLSRHFKEFELILVDDGSTDGTGEIMDQSAINDDRIKVIHNIVNLNVGVSVQRGLATASKEFVVHNAVDLPLAVEDISGLMELARGCDVLVLERKSYAGYTLWRWVTSKVNRGLIRVLFGGNIHDLNFTQIYRRDVISKVLPIARSPAFTTPEMIIRALRLGLRVKAIPVEYRPRTHGKGAFGRPHDMLWSLYDMLHFRMKVFGKLGIGKRNDGDSDAS